MASLFKNVELEFAKAASLDPAMDAAASGVLGKAKALSHHQTGAYRSSLKKDTVRTKRGVYDRVVYSDDPQAHIIEFGFTSKDGKWVPGQHILGKAAD